MDARAHRRVDERIRSQHGAIWRPQALGDGYTPRAIDHRLATGEWLELLPGVYAPACAPDTLLQRYSGAVLWAGPKAAISHRSAAAHMGLSGFESRIVEITTTRRSLRAAGIVVHHSKQLDRRDLQRRDGMTLTSAARTLIDLLSVASLEKCEMALDSALVKGYVSPPYLWKEMNRVGTIGRNHTAYLRRWVLERSGDVRPSASTSETRLFQLFRRAGLKGHCKQFEVVDAEGSMFIDYAFPDLKLAIELDSWEWHLGRAARKDDVRRQNRLERLGWTILRFFWEDAMFDPEYVLREILRTIETLAKRPLQF